MTVISPSQTSRSSLWASHILSGPAVIFLIFDIVSKFLKPQPVIDGSLALGFSEAQIPILGLILLPCLALYVVPRTAIFGAILITGYFGGVEATHMIAGSDAFSFVFPIILGAMLWGGLYLRNAKLREVLMVQR